MIKLYKKEKFRTLYAECWENNGVVTFHHGTVGSIGEVEELKCDCSREAIDKYINEYRKKGYGEYPVESQYWVVLQWSMKTISGSAYNHGIRHSAMNLLNELLGWKGLGHVDGFDMGKTQNPKEEFALNIFCLVIDDKLAIQCIIDYLPKQIDCSRLKIACKKGQEEFSLKYHAKGKENWFYL